LKNFYLNGKREGDILHLILAEEFFETWILGLKKIGQKREKFRN